ncbi:MAG TPA: hypothetical protein VGD83_36970 [Streptosporangiaceae bacterium]
MALFYVTGLSGTGKSAVLSELRVRGYHARGVDEDGYADWINRAAGTPDDFPRDAPGLDLHAWYQAHDWVLSTKRQRGQRGDVDIRPERPHLQHVRRRPR